MMPPIQSSMFSHIGYDADAMTLTVRYHPSKKQLAAEQEGDLWVYRNYTVGLPAEQPEEGWGRWFLGNVKGKYEGERVIPHEDNQPHMTVSDSAPRCELCGHPSVIHSAIGACPIVNMETLEILGYKDFEEPEPGA